MPFGQPPRPFGAQPSGPSQQPSFGQRPPSFGQPRPFGMQPPGAGQQQSQQAEQRRELPQNPFGRGSYSPPSAHPTRENPFDKADPQSRESDNPFARGQRNPFGDGPSVNPKDLENPFEDRGPNPFLEEKRKTTDKEANPFGDAADVNPKDLENPFEDRGSNPFVDEPTADKASVSDAVKNTMSTDAGDAVADNKFTELRDPYKEAAAAAEKDTSGPEMD